MAEPPSPLTELLRDAKYTNFIHEVGVRGWLRNETPDLPGIIAGLHAGLKSQRHPPGPTIEWLLIDRLVQMQILDVRTREHLTTGRGTP